MCTNKCAQPEGHFGVLGPPEQKKDDKFSNKKVHCRKVSATFFALSEMLGIPGRVKKCNFFADSFRK